MGREEKWINIAKVVAILAVLTDHTYMVLYDNDLILLGSFFSVSLFMLLSGYTFVIAAEKKRNFTLWQLTKKNLTKIMIPYVGATFIYFIIDTHSFIFDEFLNRLFHFNMSIPFYYVDTILLCAAIFSGDVGCTFSLWSSCFGKTQGIYSSDHSWIAVLIFCVRQ